MHKNEFRTAVRSSSLPGNKLRLHSQVEDYDILTQIGEGAYGLVYKARHRPTGKVVALKKIIEVAQEGVTQLLPPTMNNSWSGVHNRSS